MHPQINRGGPMPRHGGFQHDTYCPRKAPGEIWSCLKSTRATPYGRPQKIIQIFSWDFPWFINHAISIVGISHFSGNNSKCLKNLTGSPLMNGGVGWTLWPVHSRTHTSMHICVILLSFMKLGIVVHFWKELSRLPNYPTKVYQENISMTLNIGFTLKSPYLSSLDSKLIEPCNRAVSMQILEAMYHHASLNRF